MDQLLTSSQAVKALGMSVNTFNSWCRQGVVNPVVPSSGKGSTKVFSIPQVWSIAVAKSIREGGAGIEIALAVANYLESLSLDDIRASFDAGRTCLLVFNVNGELTVMPRLTSPGSITDNPTLIEQRDAAAKQGVSMMWYGIDVKPMFDQIVSKVQAKKKRTGRK